MCVIGHTVTSSLREHELIHGDEHPYSCEVCNRAFSQQSSLIRHQQGMQSAECAYN